MARKSKFKVKLISPGNGRYRPGMCDNRHNVAPLPLLTVAALTPDDYDVSIACENVERIDFNERVDLVGITGVTATSTRANQISEVYREKGVKTVAGGLYPFYHTELAEQNFDAVVVGEAEHVWKTVLEDAAGNRLKKIYKSDTLPDLKNMPFPRFDVLNCKEKYVGLRVLETSRGCPYRCEFCTPTKFRGFKFRTRPIDEVIEDVKRLKAAPDLGLPSMFFIDDNFVGNHNRTKQLLEKLIPLKVRWYSQASLEVTKDKEMMRLLQASGCEWLFVGVESLSPDVLKDTKKKSNFALDFAEAIRVLHKSRISVLGAFVFGLESETKDIFRITSDFIDESEMDAMQFNLVYPYPGIATTAKLEQEGRVIGRQWENYLLDGVNYIPKRMTIDELREGFYWLLREQCRDEKINKRIANMNTGNRYSAPVEAENWGLKNQAHTVLDRVPCATVKEHYNLCRA